MKKVLLFVAVAAMIFAAGTAQAAKKLPPKVIVGFETDQEFKDIYKENNGNRDYPVVKVTENVTQGKFACKLTFPNDGDWPGLHFVKFDGNWEGYDVLKVDVFNPSTEIVALNMSLCDKDSGITKEAYFGEFNRRYNASAILKPGKNTVEFELAGVTIEDKSRQVKLADVKRFALFVSPRPKDFTIFLDNVRIEQVEEQ